MNNQNNYNGILLIDKPSGITSHDVVDRVRRKLKIKTVGHAGTLDPMATGLLIILVGKATKSSQYLMGLRKEYEATLLLGIETDSQDADGEETARYPVPEISSEEIIQLFKTFEGDQYQLPPMYSAKKINGVPLYKLARKGKEVEREPRLINISKIQLIANELPKIKFLVGCSKGTYIRTIAHDIGRKLQCGAHLIQLRRTAIAEFHIDKSVSLEAFQAMDLADINKIVIPTYQALPFAILS